MMPGISGHEVLRRLKQDPDFVAVPVIMLTAQTEQKDVVSALHSGAIDYVIKPVDPEKLVARIGRTLDAARYTVMIADNDHLILQLLGSKYRNRGFKVTAADDGKAAWDQILKTLPDLVILDRMMPGMDGIAVLKNIRQEESTKNIPVIILSARKEERDIEIGMNFGASDYVVKPFLPDDLMTRSLKLLKDASKNRG
jgi:DNA-binding response OmpR family regulator